MTTSLRRLYGLLIKHVYTVRRAPPRQAAYIFWPFLQMLIWGFFNSYIFHGQQLLGFSFSMLLGAAMLITFVERTNANVMIAFLEDIWSRNVGNIAITPLNGFEMGMSFVIIGTLGVALGVAIAAIGAYFIFGYALWSLGLPFILWWIILTLTGWSIGLLLVAMLLRFGTGNEGFGWMAAAALSPLFCAFYPVSSLPPVLQHVAWALPPTYVFEGLRGYIATHSFNQSLYLKGLSLAVVFFIIGFATFFRQLHQARVRTGLFNVDA